LIGSGFSVPSGGGGGEGAHEAGGHGRRRSFCDDRVKALGVAAARGLRAGVEGKGRRRGGVEEKMEDAAPDAAAAAIVSGSGPGGIRGDWW
jgi:hypothetical protein